MTRMKKLPDAELDIMKVVWQLEPPVTSGMLLEGLARDTEKTWKLQTLHTLLNRLIDRGFLASEKKARDKYFYPLVQKDDYLTFETKSFVKNYHEGSLLSMMNAAYQGEGLSDQEIDELVQWAVTKRREQP
ncbi:BlaI/MecI/CopY family transcriptional regulator [Eubacteriales bacterium OttesenSCG-928-A19]|nr:BlaI/MecI/CopY family transcriptional regulator [Eubacteriales bacterium OttesenSCG-928-A19]